MPSSRRPVASKLFLCAFLAAMAIAAAVGAPTSSGASVPPDTTLLLANQFLPSGDARPAGQAVLAVLRDRAGDGALGDADGAALLAALGTCTGGADDDAGADLNGDGCVNVLDVARMRGDRMRATRGPGNRGSAGGGVAGAGGESIEIDQPLIELPQCGSGSVLVLLRNNATPLFGYSIDVDFQPAEGSTGAIVADVEMTNFYEPQNLIGAGGATMDPVFSVILDGGDGSVFVSANTDDGSTVLAQDGVNDVLAEIHFIAEPNADGEFTWVLGPATALSDGGGFAVPFAFVGGSITVMGGGVLADINEDGAVNVDDLIAVILAWGACPAPPQACPADTNGDQVVDVDDLINVILTWNCGPPA